MAWQDLMPYTVGAFVLFGLGSLARRAAGRSVGPPRDDDRVLRRHRRGRASSWPSRAGPWSLAAALTLMGAFAAIYHPVGIPMIVQGATNPGFTIGVNGLAGNLGIAIAALLTGFLVKLIGWRAAFAVPAAIAIVCGALFAMLVPREEVAPAKRTRRSRSTCRPA